MTRNFKALAFGAVFAMGAIAVSPAQATEYFHSHKERTILTGENTTNHVINFAAGVLTCEEADFKGTEVGTKNIGGTLGETWTTESVTVHPEYSECKIPVPAVVNTNNCHFKLSAATTFEMGNMELLCPAKITPAEAAKPERIEITVAGAVILLVIRPQTLTSAVKYENTKPAGETEKWDVLAHVTATGIAWECEKGKASCEVLFGASSGNAATYTGDTTIQGFVDENKGVNGGVTEEYKEGAQVGIWKGPAE